MDSGGRQAGRSDPIVYYPPLGAENDERHGSSRADKTMMVLGVDPGPEQSAYVVFDGLQIREAAILENTALLKQLITGIPIRWCPEVLVAEKVESFGMAVGASVFETVFWTGRFLQAWAGRSNRLSRREVKLHLCHSARATDANIRQAIIDRYGGSLKAIGKKAAPGPLYGLKSHCWAAFAVALTWFDQHGHETVVEEQAR